MAKQSFNAKDIAGKFKGKSQSVNKILTPIISILFGKEQDIKTIRLRRFVALVIDIIILVLLTRLELTGTFILVIAYFFLFEGVLGIGSIGKLVTGLKVEMETFKDEQEDDSTYNGHILRNSLRSIIKGTLLALTAHTSLLIPLLILYIPYRYSTVGRGVYDAVAGTYVNAKEDVLKLTTIEPNRLYKRYGEGFMNNNFNRQDNAQEDTSNQTEGNKESNDSTMSKDELDGLY